MFHIVFNADENYVKYNAVLITSIIHNTDTTRKFTDFIANNANDSKKMMQNSDVTPPPRIHIESLSAEELQEGYVFHILTDSLQQETANKLNNLARELSIIYPCEIIIHTADSTHFRNLKQWNKIFTHDEKLYAAYYRLCMAQFLPDNLKRCLYLDVDMLVVGDVRELFAIDLKNNIAGVVFDPGIIGTDFIRLTAKNHADNDIVFSDSSYFNSGFMLINLIEWRQQNIEKQLVSLCDTYDSQMRDQDFLNCVIGDNTLKLPLKWNIMITWTLGVFPIENSRFSTQDFEAALKDAKIYHLTWITKPWQNFTQCLKYDYTIIGESPQRDLWWQMAEQTPIFKDELQYIRLKLKNKELQDYADALANRLHHKLHVIDSQISTLQRRLNRIAYPHKTIIKKLRQLFKKIIC